MTQATIPAAVLFTIEEAAIRLNIGRTTMYSLVSTGAIRSVTIGRLRRIPSECIDAYVSVLLSECQQPQSTAA